MKGTNAMKKITAIMLVLCLALTLLTAVACKDNGYDEYEETPDIADGALDLETNDGAVTAPPTDEDTEDNAYIGAVPSNDEPGWGALVPAPGK